MTNMKQGIHRRRQNLNLAGRDLRKFLNGRWLHYTSAPMCEYYFSNKLWDYVLVITLFVWVMYATPYFDDLSNPRWFFVSKGRRYHPPVVQARSVNGTRELLRPPSPEIRDVWAQFTVPASRNAMLACCSIIAACIWLPSLAATLLQRESETSEWKRAVQEQDLRRHWCGAFRLGLMGTFPFDEYNHEMRYPPTLENKLWPRVPMRRRGVGGGKKKKKWCNIPRSVLIGHKYLLIFLIMFVVGVAEIGMMETSDMTVFTVLTAFGWVAMAILPLLQFDRSPVDCYNRKKNLVPKEQIPKFQQLPFDLNPELPRWLVQHGGHTSSQTPARIAATSLLTLLLGVPQYMAIEIVSHESGGGGLGLVLLAIHVIIVSILETVALVNNTIPYLYLEKLDMRHLPLHLQPKSVRRQAWCWLVCQIIPFLCCMTFGFLLLAKAPSAAAAPVDSNTIGTGTAGGGLTWATVFQPMWATTSFVLLYALLREPVVFIAMIAVLTPFITFLGLLIGYLDRTRAGCEPELQFVRGKGTCRIETFVTPLHIATVILSAVAVFLPPLLRKKRHRFEQYKMNVQIGTGTGVSGSVGAAQGRVVNVKQLQQDTRKRWARAGLKVIMANRFANAKTIGLGGANGGGGTSAASKALAGFGGLKPKPPINPTLRKIVPASDDNNPSAATLALMSGMSSLSTPKKGPLEPLQIKPKPAIHIPVVPRSPVVDDPDKLEAKKMMERQMAAGRRASMGGGRRKSIAPPSFDEAEKRLEQHDGYGDMARRQSIVDREKATGGAEQEMEKTRGEQREKFEKFEKKQAAVDAKQEQFMKDKLANARAGS